MASITSTGIGSGLDVGGIVEQLVAAEGQPAQQRFARQEARAQSELSAYGTLKSALSDFRDQLDGMKSLNSLLTRKASSGNEELFAVVPDETAIPASYSVEVVQLAQAAKLTSGAFADSDAVVGTGTLTIGVGALSFDVEITEENNTLAGIRDAINAAVDNAGVSATIVNADAGSYLILSGTKTGASREVSVSQAAGDGGLAALTYDAAAGTGSLTQSQAAQDAQVRIDGFDVYSETNTVTGAIDGVSIDLLGAAPGETNDAVIEYDVAAVRSTITDFVESYNELVDTVGSLTSYNQETQQGGPLLGDATLRGLEAQLRREFSTPAGNSQSPFGTLAEIGVSLQIDGKLAVDDTRLDEALGTNFQDVGRLFAAEDGFAVRLFDRVDRALSDDGAIETRTEGLNNRIERIEEQRESLNRRLEALETRLLRQFNALDSLVSQLNNTSSFLAQQLANLPTPGKDS
ncbi:flagellar filament capping protein FliD [Lentisalinibacter sediminis]|uniref:flagellar filament capping protein FliD n=1 Tax=Lentisalinibacter sediminis TaxID=2992237 RepID=UPI00386EB1B3